MSAVREYNDGCSSSRSARLVQASSECNDGCRSAGSAIMGAEVQGVQRVLQFRECKGYCSSGSVRGTAVQEV